MQFLEFKISEHNKTHDSNVILQLKGDYGCFTILYVAMLGAFETTGI